MRPERIGDRGGSRGGNRATIYAIPCLFPFDVVGVLVFNGIMLDERMIFNHPRLFVSRQIVKMCSNSRWSTTYVIRLLSLSLASNICYGGWVKRYQISREKSVLPATRTALGRTAGDRHCSCFSWPHEVNVGIDISGNWIIRTLSTALVARYPEICLPRNQFGYGGSHDPSLLVSRQITEPSHLYIAA